MGTWGGGGWPPTPPLSFFYVGGTLPPMCRATWGSPPSPSGPGRAIREIPKKNSEPKNPRRRFHRKYRIRLCRKRGSHGYKGGRGVAPYPPCAGQRGDHPLFVRIVATMTGPSGWIAGVPPRYLTGMMAGGLHELHPRLNGGSENTTLTTL